jgi:hypothetical protein
MAVYGPVRHQKNSIWTEASYGSIWTGPYTAIQYMDRSIYCHMTRSDMNYFLSKIMQVPGRSIYENSDRLR